MPERITNEIRAVDSNGMLHRIIEYTEIESAGTFGDPDATEEGMKRLVMEDGRSVNPRGNYFEIVAAGEILTRP